ncbi:hypothetical protein [Streptomyces ipomoeae]|uniref:hypothetical protein n=1 Tax=Streptomyces ipomoeae TaxID=103232 RepID=UPI0029B13E62|nr:hypothetical protein [Streptomyces ipomoeae]MDX2700573.1 hypothetical protein [Streptomyces ipomoeae]MDX2845417.1 hypothetical protein [Streptomyces ipomoeae]
MSEPIIVDIYAAALSVAQKPATLRQWIHRGEITHHGYDKRRRVLVDINELQKVVVDKAKKAQQDAA